MQCKMNLKLLLVFLSLTLNLSAIDGKIKVFIPSNDTIYTSQKVMVSVELLSNAFSITDARITFPASNKYIIQAPQSASYLGQEVVGDEDWQMVHYDYEVYALQAEKIEIPSISVSFTASMGYGQPKKEFELTSDALFFDVKAPQGVKADQFILVTDNFVLESEVKLKTEKLIVGDAVELSVTQKADGVPDILFAPIEYTSNAFMRVYPKEPELKSGLTGKYDVLRTDRFTFVATQEGNVTLPAQERLWYNSVTKEIHTEKINAMSYEILPDPQIALDAKTAQQKQLLLYLALTLFVVIGLYVILAPKIRRYKEEQKHTYKESETGKFALLMHTLESDDLSSVYKHLYIWLLSISPELSRGGFRKIIELQPSFSKPLHQLSEKIIDPNQAFDTNEFSKELYALRKILLEREKKETSPLPQSINPS